MPSPELQIIGDTLQNLLSSPNSGITRSSLFITSKLSPYNLKTPRAALEKTLQDLKLDYLDCYLIHWPAVSRKSITSPIHKTLRLEAWKVLNEAKAEGLIRHIGVSNFTPAHIRELQDSQWGIKGAVVQMELHPWYWRDAVEIQTLFKEDEVQVVGYALLGEGKVLGEEGERLDGIAERNGMTRVQVVLAWALRKGFSVLVRSTDEKHMVENLETQNLLGVLSEKECSVIDAFTTRETEKKMCWDPRDVR